MMLETDRLILREMQTSDFDAFYKIFTDSEMSKFYPYKFDSYKVKLWIERNIERYKVYGFGLFALCLKETGEVIGDCGLTMQNIDGFIRPEIGYHIRKDMQKKGYATEACVAIRDWAFNNTPFNILYSYMASNNIASIKTAIAYKAKFSFEYINNGVNTSVYCITKEEYNNLK